MKVEITKELLEDCLTEGLSLEAIGRRVGRSPSTISYHLNKHGLIPVNAAKHANRGALDRDELASLAEHDLSLREIAEAVDRSPSTVRCWISNYGLATRPRRLRRPELREAKANGDRHVVSSCRRHGDTVFVLEGRGYYRCMKCRQEAVSEWRRRSKRRLVEDSGGACLLCGYSDYPGALQFHHLDPGEKDFAISRSGVTRRFSELEAEAEKCVLLCANCHAEVEGGYVSLVQ